MTPGKRANEPSISQKGRNWFVRLRYDGNDTDRLAGTTRSMAKQKAKQAAVMRANGAHFDEIVEVVFGDIGGARSTFVEISAMYIDQVLRPRAEKKASKRGIKVGALHSFRNDEYLNKGLCQLAWAKKKRAAEVQPRDLNQWATEKRKTHSNGTVNRYLAMASSVFGHAVQQGWLNYNPMRDVKRGKEAPGRDVYLTPEQYHLLSKHAEPELRPLILCAVSTGMRRGDLLALRWQDVDLSEGTLLVRAETTKTGKERRVPMCLPLRESLSELHASCTAFDIKDRGGAVFRCSDGVAYTGTRLRKRLQRALDAWAIESAKHSDEVETHCPKGFVFHCLRHTAASFIANQGGDLMDVVRVFGCSMAMAQRYAHLFDDATKKAVHPLDAVLKRVQ